jgi:hypothetical protein
VNLDMAEELGHELPAGRSLGPIDSVLVCWSCWSKWCDFNNRKSMSANSGGWKPEVKVSAGWCLWKTVRKDLV